jgi:4-amino-4-deoxy-L-arabinose transferase-like glycosyltransferase
LTKNPIGLAVPLLAIAGFILITRDWELIVETKPWWGLVLFLLIILPWFIIVFRSVPKFFEVLYQETLFRYTDPGKSPHYEPFYYYIPALGAFAPWVIFLPGMVISVFSRKNRPLSTSHIFLITTFMTTFLLFSSVGSKREYYLLPLYPILAILVAKFWDEYISMKSGTEKQWTWKTMVIPILGFAAFLCLAGVAMPLGVKLYLPPQYLWTSLGFEVLFLTIGIALFITFFRGHVVKEFGMFVIATVLIYVFALTIIVPEMDRYRSRKDFFHKVASIAGEHPIIDYNYEGFETQFYLQRIVSVLHTTSELQKLLTNNNPTFVITTGGHYDKLQRKHPELLAKFKIVLDRVWTSAINPKRQKRLLLLKTSHCYNSKKS